MGTNLNRNRKNNRKYIRDYKRRKGCAKCDENHVSCLEFHHLFPNDKKLTVSRMVSKNYSLDRIKREISKCIVLCKNCHAKLHWFLKKDLTNE